MLKFPLLFACIGAVLFLPQEPSMPRIPDHAHAFDFWTGSWKLTWGDTNTATNVITKEMDGHVIAEHFEQAAIKYRGASWSMYDSTNDRWQQTWVDNQGGYFALTGGWSTDRMILSTAPLKPGGLRFQRMVFSDIEHDAFNWDWMSTTDGGATWKSQWRIHYQRSK